MNGMEKKSYFVDLMLMMGIPVHRAIGEAELVCSALLKDNLVCGILSRDTDHLVLGCSSLFLSIGSQVLQKLDMNKLLYKLNLTKMQFVDFCILCGTDYNMPYRTSSRYLISPEQALDIIHRYRSIEIAAINVSLPTTMHIECRETYTLKQGCMYYSNDTRWMNPSNDVWQMNKDLLVHLGMNAMACKVLNEYYNR